MAEIYGHRFTSAFGERSDCGAALTWGKGLAGITPAQLADGLIACLASADPWPPSLPEFRARCLGIPAFADVQQQITGAGDRSPFAVLVWSHVDSHRYRNASADRAERMLRDAYDGARVKVMRGHQLPQPVTGVLAAGQAPDSPTPCDPAVAQQAFAELDELFSSAVAPAVDAAEAQQ